MREQTSRNGSWLDVLPGAVVVADREGTVIYVNAAAAQLLGHAPGELVGRAFDDAVGLHDPATGTWWACSRALRELRGVRGVPARTLERPGPDGAQPVTLSATFLREPGGRLSQVVCLLNDAGREPGHVMAQPAVLSAIAHDVRSPLTSIKGFGATLQRRWERFGDEQRRELLGTIVQDADRLSRMLRELVEAARVDAHVIPRRRAPLEVSPLVEAGLGRAVAAAGGALERDVEISVAGEPGIIYGDRERLEQAIADVVEHAVSVSEDHGPVRVHVRGDGARVCVDVVPTGPQLPAVLSARLFSVTGRHAAGGTGLGLFIAKGVVQSHGGDLVLVAEPGAGTGLRFVLPRGVDDHG